MRSERKTIPMRASDGGSGREEVDAGRYFRCWNCGFVCDIDRDALDDGRHGATTTIYTTASAGASSGDPLSPFTLVDGTGILDVMVPQVDAAGGPVVVRNVYEVGGTGCPLCHTRAWKK